jgi:nitrite reductase/ring-hydroxylating ferredoxin subunit
MAEDEAKLAGPDLVRGVRLDDIPKGGTLVGHVNGKHVLLVRVRDEVFAVSHIAPIIMVLLPMVS